MTITHVAARESVASRQRRTSIGVLSGSAASASGYDVPAGFMGVADVLILCVAASVARWITPAVQWLTTAERLAGIAVFAWLNPPSASAVSELQSFREIAWVPLVMIPLTLFAMHWLGGYRPVLEQSRTRLWLASVLAPVLSLSVLSLIIIAIRNQHTSRAFLFTFTILSAAALLACRKAVRYYKSRRLQAGHYARNVIVIGRRNSRSWVTRHFAANVSPHFYRVCGFLETSDDPDLPEDSLPRPEEGPPVLGQVADLGELLIHKPIHDVLVLHGVAVDQWLQAVIEHCEYFQVTLRLVPEVLVGNHSPDWLTAFGRGPLRLPDVVLRQGALNPDALFVKRLFDIVVSAALLAALSPLLLLIAIAIKLTTPSLSVLYPWRVIGYKGRPFTGYKFTTMYADADRRMEELRDLNEMQGPVFKMKADPRVTPLGRILRKFSLNELPQLWSVLKGDMSLVGPRPAYPNELVRYELWHKRKLCVQPGITCLWQVRGRNRISNFDDWVRMDFEYIDNWSLWLDCRILIRTALVVIAGTGA